jgi:hypothetical protein
MLPWDGFERLLRPSALGQPLITVYRPGMDSDQRTSREHELIAVIRDLRVVEHRRSMAAHGSAEREALLDAEEQLRRRILELPLPDVRHAR